MQSQPAAADRGIFSRGFRLIGSYIRAHPGPFSASLVGALLYALGTIGSTYALGYATDEVVLPAFETGVTSRMVLLGTAAILAAAAMRAVGIGVRRYYSGMAGERVMQSIRLDVADRYKRLPAAFHRTKPTGELLAHMEADVSAAVDVFFPVPFAVGATFLMIFAAISLITTDLYMAATGLLIIPSLIWVNRTFALKMEAPVKEAQDRLGDVSRIAHESIDGALVVKTLGREESETQRLAAAAEAVRVARVDAGRVRATFEPLVEALPTLGIVLLVAVGSWRVGRGDLQLGTVVRFVWLLYLLSWPMRFIGWILAELPRALVGKARVDTVLAQPITVEPPTGDGRVHLPDGPLGVDARGLRYSFDGVTVLDGVNLEVPPDGSVAIVGTTGSGKSLLAQLLVRLDDPDDGEVLLGGVNVRHVDPVELHTAATLVFQESFLFTTSVAENIALDAEIGREEVERAARLARADGFIHAMPEGYDTVVGERGVTLSGGQRQRVALARALARRPRVLILDDATSAVDPAIEAEILGGLRRELATTLIVVAYRRSTIALADRVVVLDRGRIIASGRHEELLGSEPRYAEIVRAYEREGR